MLVTWVVSELSVLEAIFEFCLKAFFINGLWLFCPIQARRYLVSAPQIDRPPFLKSVLLNDSFVVQKKMRRVYELVNVLQSCPLLNCPCWSRSRQSHPRPSCPRQEVCNSDRSKGTHHPRSRHHASKHNMQP